MAKSISKKAQAEMIGLIVIVMIVVSLMLLYIVYKINNPERNIKSGFVNNELAYNFLTTTNKVNIANCPQHNMVDLITDCAKDTKSIFCDGELACIVVNRTMREILTSTFEPLGKDFEFYIESTDIRISGACSNKEKAQATQPLTLYPTNERIKIVLDVCDAD